MAKIVFDRDELKKFMQRVEGGILMDDGDELSYTNLRTDDDSVTLWPEISICETDWEKIKKTMKWKKWQKKIV